MNFNRHSILFFLVVLLFGPVYAEAATEGNTSISDEDELEYKLLFFREDCYNEFLDLNFFYKDCISITISKGLGYGIILGAMLVKFPQIYNILKARSGRGILPSMFYMECFMFIINGCYNIHLNSPFSVYGENFALLIQNFVVIALLWLYGNKTSNVPKAIVTLSIFGTFSFLYFDALVPDFMWKLFMDIQILMVAYSRLPQILANFRSKFTGELSSIMFLANALGNLARTYTFIKETQDVYNMFTSGLSTLLNFTIFLQVLIYWKNNQVYKNRIEVKDLESQSNESGRTSNPEEFTKKVEVLEVSEGRPSL